MAKNIIINESHFYKLFGSPEMAVGISVDPSTGNEKLSIFRTPMGVYGLCGLPPVGLSGSTDSFRKYNVQSDDEIYSEGVSAEYLRDFESAPHRNDKGVQERFWKDKQELEGLAELLDRDSLPNGSRKIIADLVGDEIVAAAKL